MLSLLSLLFAAIPLPIAFIARGVVADTSLGVARFTLALALLDAFVFALFHTAAPLSDPWFRQWQLLQALLLLLPPMSVLGARRPGLHAWNAFVLLPMLLVFGWPAVATWRADAPPDVLLLEGPQWLGIALVTVMGCGNYFGTRFTAAALFYAAAVACLVLPLSGAAEWPGQQSQMLATLALALSAISAIRPLRRLLAEPERSPSRLWRDFRDLFGVVWAKRVMDRLNEAAVAEIWNASLDLDGFHPQPAYSTPSDSVATPLSEAATQQRIEHWLRVLLRRFVDPAWITHRLPEVSHAVTKGI